MAIIENAAQREFREATEAWGREVKTEMMRAYDAAFGFAATEHDQRQRTKFEQYTSGHALVVHIVQAIEKAKERR